MTRHCSGEVVKLTNYDPETVGMLLKLYLRELPEPLLTRQLGAQFEGVLRKSLLLVILTFNTNIGDIRMIL